MKCTKCGMQILPFNIFCNHCATKVGNVFALKNEKRIPDDYIDDNSVYSRFEMMAVVKGQASGVANWGVALNDYSLYQVVDSAYQKQIRRIPKPWKEDYPESKRLFYETQHLFKEVIPKKDLNSLERLKLLRTVDPSIGFFVVSHTSNLKTNGDNLENNEVVSSKYEAKGVYFNEKALLRLILLLVSYCPKTSIKAQFVDKASANPIEIKVNYERGLLTINGRRTYLSRNQNLALFNREYISLREFILEEDIQYYNYSIDGN